MAKQASYIVIAQWMFDTLLKDGVLYQDEVVSEILAEFGEDYVYINDNGNYGIGRDVLKQFRQLSEPDVIWERSERCWRFKMEHERGEGRQTD